MPSLERAIPLAKVDEVAVLVAQELNFDVARPQNRPFQEQLS